MGIRASQGINGGLKLVDRSLGDRPFDPPARDREGRKADDERGSASVVIFRKWRSALAAFVEVI
ncbi:MAG: hypothetical protein MSC31_18455 [Solirubrobacteraceae bacterium MAG38_C4-C5]|nr:hypothetical protein [Candidatus Siliceabacter maunaloa]